jgi:hypothetical protein
LALDADGNAISEPVMRTDMAAMRKLADRTNLLVVEDLSLHRAVGYERVTQCEMKQTIGNASY